MAGAEIDELFRPTSSSIRQLLSDIVDGFSIPAYQRAYRWDPAQLRRLVETFLEGVDRLSREDEAVSFIGALITVTGGTGKHPVPVPGARQVIDGQQRLT